MAIVGRAKYTHARAREISRRRVYFAHPTNAITKIRDYSQSKEISACRLKDFKILKMKVAFISRYFFPSAREIFLTAIEVPRSEVTLVFICPLTYIAPTTHKPQIKLQRSIRNFSRLNPIVCQTLSYVSTVNNCFHLYNFNASALYMLKSHFQVILALFCQISNRRLISYLCRDFCHVSSQNKGHSL